MKKEKSNLNVNNHLQLKEIYGKKKLKFITNRKYNK